MKVYLVGGAVRDHLLGFPIRERDYVVVGSCAADLLSLGYQSVGKDFPVFLHPQTKDEYALARTERKSGRGYTQFQFHSTPDVTLEDDLKRRDLTINAMAMTPEGEVIDPYFGQQDLKNKVLRHVSESFIEDPVRILRIARFYARFAKLGFSIAHETMVLMREMVRNGEINFLIAERVWQELSRALQEEEPQKFFECLRGCGALKILFPEIDQLFGVPNPPLWHPEIDSGVHTLMVLQQAAKLSEKPETRFAALLHDLGKGVTPSALLPKHHGHEEKSVALIKALCVRLRVPKNFGELALLVARFHGLIHKAFELRPGTILELFEKTDALRRPERFLEILNACMADARGRPGFETADYPQKEYFLNTLTALTKIDVSPLVQQGLSGETLKMQLRQLRLEVIKKLLSTPI